MPHEYEKRVESRMSDSTLWGDGGASEKKAMMSDEDDDEDEDLPDLPSSPRTKDTTTTSPRFAGLFGTRSRSPARYPTSTTQAFPPLSPPSLSRPLSPLSQASSYNSTPIPPPGAVPATPSLINALHRVNAAQRQARGDLPLSNVKEGSGEGEGRKKPEELARQRQPSWDEWWKDVVEKAEKK